MKKSYIDFFLDGGRTPEYLVTQPPDTIRTVHLSGTIPGLWINYTFKKEFLNLMQKIKNATKKNNASNIEILPYDNSTLLFSNVGDIDILRNTSFIPNIRRSSATNNTINF